MKRALIIVLDSVGIGEAADAAAFGDCGSNTLGHIGEAFPLALPNLQLLGLGNLVELPTVPPVDFPQAAVMKMRPKSVGKDTTIGHWEIAGIIMKKPLPTYPNGFPAEVLERFTKATGRGVLGNCVASGTAIIQKLGAEHLQTGKLICYTSADSVFQIAAHEELVPPQELYQYCLQAREILQGEHGVGRVIARPFIGNAAEGFTRTENRRDFSLQPPQANLLEKVKAAGQSVIAIGKITDIFAGEGITDIVEAHNNSQSAQGLFKALAMNKNGLIFDNFVDFDMLYGHRNNIEGYAQALQDFDAILPQIIAALGKKDIMFITADHGNDPSTSGTDHSRENVPLLVYGQGIKCGKYGERASFADLGATVAEYLSVEKLPAGESFLNDIWRG